MRAIQITEFGGPEVLRLVDLPVPEPAEGEVLVRVSRAGLNFADTHQRRDQYVARAALPMVPGLEVAGVREDTGERVVALTGGAGGYAEYAAVPARLTFPIPDGIDDGTALALLLQGQTAWHLYRSCAHLAAGESVVVHAAAGGVGTLAVQLGRALGAGRVIATASTEDKRRLAVSLGADAAVDGAPEGLAERLIEANEGARVDVVLEIAGGAVFDASLQALARRGRIVVYGIASREQNEVRTGGLLKRSQSVIGFWLFDYLDRREAVAAALDELYGLAAGGGLQVVVGDTYALADAAEAQSALAQRRTVGKVLLDPGA